MVVSSMSVRSPARSCVSPIPSENVMLSRAKRSPPGSRVYEKGGKGSYDLIGR